MTTTPRTMPTESDVPEITLIAQVTSGDSNVFSVSATSGGVLVRHSSRYGPDPDDALQGQRADAA